MEKRFKRSVAAIGLGLAVSSPVLVYHCEVGGGDSCQDIYSIPKGMARLVAESTAAATMPLSMVNISLRST